MLINFFLSRRWLLHLLNLLLIFIYAFYINRISGNYGVVPPDSFGHFDTSYLINKNIFPIRDYWMNSGFLINFIQSYFFYFFGTNWQSYVLHASFFNALIALSSYLFFINLKINYKYSFFYTICVATLFYPTIGTPALYFHSSFFSLISIYSFIICYLKKSKILACLIPIFILIGFLCAQIPSAYIGVLIIFSFLSISFKEQKLFFFFLLGSALALILLILLLIITKIQFIDFLYQHILFPMSIGGTRFLNESDALSPVSNITLDRVFFDFKFIYVFWIPILIITLKNILSKHIANYKKNFINIFFLLSVLLFIFYQLTTNNQLFIYFLIPITAAVLHYNLNVFNIRNKINFLFILLIIFSTLKYAHRNIIEKRFNDFQLTDMSIFIDAKEISPKLKGLKWVTPLNWGLSYDVKKEVEIIKKISVLMKTDNRNKVVMTNFQLFSIISNNKVFLIQHGFFQNGTHPDEKSKFYQYYSRKYNEFLEKNNIEVVYFIDIKKSFFKKIIKKVCKEGEININEYKIYFIEINKCK